MSVMSVTSVLSLRNHMSPRWHGVRGESGLPERWALSA
jgi:hypothetical protein